MALNSNDLSICWLSKHFLTNILPFLQDKCCEAVVKSTQVPSRNTIRWLALGGFFKALCSAFATRANFKAVKYGIN